MGIFDEARAAQQREREREERFSRITTEFKKLDRQEQALLMAKLANIADAAVDAAPAPDTTATAPTNGKMVPLFRLPRVKSAAATEVVAAGMNVTPLTKKVVREATSPLKIDEIVALVLKLNPEAPKQEIYSAVYKAAKRDEFRKDEITGAYTYNADYRRAAGGGQ